MGFVSVKLRRASQDCNRGNGGVKSRSYAFSQAHLGPLRISQAYGAQKLNSTLQHVQRTVEVLVAGVNLSTSFDSHSTVQPLD